VTDRTPFTDSEAAAAWNRGAKAWNAFVESGADYYRHEVHGPALLSACEPLRGLRVLDLGCGQGFFSRHLARRGARVVGVDVAKDLLAVAQAREAEERLGIEYRMASASDVARAATLGSFDLVAACMSLQDVADVGAALRGVFACLRPGGRLVFSVPHPATDTPFREWERDHAGRKESLKIDRYFQTGPATCRWNMPRLTYHWSTPCWRYTLSEWIGLVVDAGFTIRVLEEPRPTAEQVAANPHLEDCGRVPFFLIFSLRKVSAMCW
jgi:2-polyprenyl-3-methyl-5-hydroxy-6-metoxy-1,4-benzoquinol methylase